MKTAAFVCGLLGSIIAVLGGLAVFIGLMASARGFPPLIGAGLIGIPLMGLSGAVLCRNSSTLGGVLMLASSALIVLGSLKELHLVWPPALLLALGGIMAIACGQKKTSTA